MNTNNDTTFLDSLFEQARVEQPAIDDAGFSAGVVAALPSAQQQNYVVNDKRFSWYDALGLGIGAIACFSIVEPSHLITMANNILPDRLVLSPLTLLSASLTMAALAFAGWQSLEGDLRH